jgi:hypothetical protein
MGMQTSSSGYAVTPNSFVSEVQDFRSVATDPALTADEKKRAYGVIVKHAAMLDPRDAGYEGAGIALKLALCTWLDSQPH